MKTTPPPITLDFTNFTQSEMTMWDECSEKWYRRYAERIDLKNARPNWSLLYGTALHDALDKWRANVGECAVFTWFANLQIKVPANCLPLLGEDEAELEYWNAHLRTQVERYCTYYQSDFTERELLQTEQVLTTEFMNVTLTGKIDSKWREGKVVQMWDTKTCSDVSMSLYEGWHFKFQFMFYLWLSARTSPPKEIPKEMVVDAVIKTKLRRGKNESMEALNARIKADMVLEPSKYFKRVKLPLIQHSLETFENLILKPKIDRIRLTQEAQRDNITLFNLLARNKNTDACINYNKTCPYLPLCAHGQAEEFRYQRRTHKHEELA